MAEPADDEPPGVPEWVVTYGDMMSLLLTFFIMLVSMSELKSDNGAVRAMMDSMRQQFGPTDGRSSAPGRAVQRTSSNEKLSSESSRSEGGTERSGRKSDGVTGPHLTVQRLRDGTVITLGGPATFEPHSATPAPDLGPDLDALAEILIDRPNCIVVRGHASPEELIGRVPKSSDHADRWQLSFDRANNVATELTRRGIEPQRVFTSAVGDTEPRVVTTDDAERAVNRRVDVFVVDSYITAPRPAETDAP